MNKKEIKQYLRNLINSSLKIQNEKHKHIFYLSYNKSYVRALKLSKITGQPVNKEIFKDGEFLFSFDTKSKYFSYYFKICDYLFDNYSENYEVHFKIIEEVFEEYEEYEQYKDFKHL